MLFGAGGYSTIRSTAAPPSVVGAFPVWGTTLGDFGCWWSVTDCASVSFAAFASFASFARFVLFWLAKGALDELDGVDGAARESSFQGGPFPRISRVPRFNLQRLHHLPRLHDLFCFGVPRRRDGHFGALVRMLRLHHLPRLHGLFCFWHAEFRQKVAPTPRGWPVSRSASKPWHAHYPLLGVPFPRISCIPRFNRIPHRGPFSAYFAYSAVQPHPLSGSLFRVFRVFRGSTSTPLPET